MRAIPDDLDPDVVAHVDARLRGIEADGVCLAWAVESGSRAWGFPSPDSDYDCRFLYVRRRDDYLTPWLPRDVIETPLDRVYDVNGWDVRKALQLMVRGNATVLEWLRSPIVYRGDPGFRDLLVDLAAQVSEPELLARHYAHVGRQNWERAGADDPGGPVRLKSVFYALRPAATLRWLRAHPEEGVPPMRLQDLLAQVPPPPDVAEAVADLVTRKARTRELGTGPVPAPVRTFVQDELYASRLDGPGRRRLDVDAAQALAAVTFRAVVERFGG